jgi:hypothetical protein
MIKQILNTEGYGREIDLLARLEVRLADRGILSSSNFDFEQNTLVRIDNIFLQIYESDKECTLEEAKLGFFSELYGSLSVVGQSFGYSEYTINEFNLSTARLGGHNIQDIINNKKDKYLHVIISQVKL